jgi:predicted acyl esterase
MPAASVLSEDGGRSAGEVAPGVTLVKNVRIPVRDGTRLAADVYFPSSALEDGDPVSLVMEYIPYRKDEVAPGTASTSTSAAGLRGRRVDIRGSGASPGTTRDEYYCRSSSTESMRSSGSVADHGAPGT